MTFMDKVASAMKKFISKIISSRTLKEEPVRAVMRLGIVGLLVTSLLFQAWPSLLSEENLIIVLVIIQTSFAIYMVSWMSTYVVSDPIEENWGTFEKSQKLFLFLSSLLMTIFISAKYFDWDSQGMYNMFIVIGGFLAICGAFVRVNRIENDQKRKVTENIGQVIEQLGKGNIITRCSYLNLLQHIAAENPGKLILVRRIFMNLVCEKSRFRVGKKGVPLAPLGEDDRADVEMAVRYLGHISLRFTPDGIHFEKLDLRHFDLGFAEFKKCRFLGMHLEEANLLGSDFYEAFFKNAHLEDAHLQTAKMEKVFMVDSFLDKANLSFVLLDDARLEGISLYKTRFIGALLRRAVLKQLKIDETNFKDAVFEETDCSGVDFSNAHNLTQLQIDQMLYWCEEPLTVPANLKEPKDGAYDFVIHRRKLRRKRVASGKLINESKALEKFGD